MLPCGNAIVLARAAEPSQRLFRLGGSRGREPAFDLADANSRPRVMIDCENTRLPVSERIDGGAFWKPAQPRWHGPPERLPQPYLRSKRSRFMTLFQAATKSRTNFSFASSCA